MGIAEIPPYIEGLEKVDIFGKEITVYEDGRIMALKNPELLTSEQKSEILKLMRFTDEEISSFSNTLQNDLLADGGVKVDIEIDDIVHIYTDLEGNDHVVTDNNRSEIDNLRQQDFTRYIINQGIGITSSLSFPGVVDGIFTGRSLVTFLGTTSNGQEYEYKYRTTFEYPNQGPINSYEDTIAQAWQSHTTSVQSDGEYIVHFGHRYDKYDVDIDHSNVYGTKGDIDIKLQIDAHHYGHLEDLVRIPIIQAGTTGQFASGYAHAWSNFNIGVTFYAVTINWGSAWGDKWTWKNSFEYIGDPNPAPVN